MTARTISYSVGNENNPADPWGRSELVIRPDGSARLDHYFSRLRTAAAWTGHVDDAALSALRAALDLAGFPAVPRPASVSPDSTLRRLSVESDGTAQEAVIGWHHSPSLPGYAEAFDLLDGVIRQLSGAAVGYPTRQQPIVRGIAAVPGQT